MRRCKVLGIYAVISILLFSVMSPVMSEPMLLPNGDRYQGELVSGLFEGQGEYLFINGDRLTAVFRQGQPQEGTFNGWNQQYQGGFLEWRYHGQGVLKDTLSGNTYEGEFDLGELIEGMMTDAAGHVYRGDFAGGVLHGHGQIEFVGGMRFIGEFANGRPLRGEQVVTDKDGKEVRTEGVMQGSRLVPKDAVLSKSQRALLHERVLNENPGRLARAIAALEDSVPGRQDVYYLLVGGDADDSVFVREVEVVKNWLHQHIPHAQGITLLNDRTFDHYPAATRHTIMQSLEALQARMNPEEDVLFVHLASHGAKGSGDLTLAQPYLSLPSFMVGDLWAGLKDVPAVIVVSACFSGHWIDELKNDKRLIMTSARRDRTSFGCGNDSEMTWFTRALYLSHKNPTHKPASFFRKVKREIARWEKDQKIETLSDPQLFVGSKAPVLSPFKQ